MVRRHLAGLPPEKRGWLAGLRDPAAGRSFAAVRTRVSEPWTTNALARDVNLLRSAYVEQFAPLISAPPTRYLLNWRMMIAIQKLRETRLMIAQIAFELGYPSETASARAFGREAWLSTAALV